MLLGCYTSLVIRNCLTSSFWVFGISVKFVFYLWQNIELSTVSNYVFAFVNQVSFWILLPKYIYIYIWLQYPKHPYSVILLLNKHKTSFTHLSKVNVIFMLLKEIIIEVISCCWYDTMLLGTEGSAAAWKL